MIISDPALLAAVREHFPSATRIRVASPTHVWVDCDGQPDWSGWDRYRPACTVRLGTSPATCVLEARAVALSGVTQ